MSDEAVRKVIMRDKLVAEIDTRLGATGRMVCVSCNLWNCWHQHGEPCDIYGCQCELGSHDEPE